MSRSVLTRLSLVLVLVLAAAPAAARADELPAPVLSTPADGDAVTANPTLRWEAVPRATRYQVQITPPTGSVKTIDTYALAAVPTTELPLGTSTWKVRTYNANAPAAFGAWSETRTFTRGQAAAPTVTAPAGGAQIDLPDAPVLRWDAVPGAHHYTVEVDDESTFGVTNRKSYETANTSLALPTALPADSLRYWHVRAATADGTVTTQWSSTRSFKVKWPAATKPALLTPADTLATDVDDPVFTWTAVPGAAKYDFQISTAPDFPADPTATTTQRTAMTSYRPKSALAADEYYWRVRALGRDGTTTTYNPTDWSPYRSIKRQWLEGAAPARPVVSMADTDGSLLNGHQVEFDQVRIAWTPVPHAAYYELEVSTSAAFDGALTRRCNTPNTEWTPYLSGEYVDSDAGSFGACAWTGTPTSAAATRFITVGGGPYYVRVRGVDVRPSGEKLYSAYSNQATTLGGMIPDPVTFTAVAPTRPTTDPSKPAEVVDSPDSQGTPTLTWKPVTGAVAYRFLLAKDENFTNRRLDGSIVTTNTALTINQVLDDNVAGQPYYWLVVPCFRWDAAVDVENNCPVGDSAAIGQTGYFETFEKRGREVGHPTAAATQQDTVALSWDDHFATSPTGNAIKWYDVEVYDSQGTKVEDIQTDATGYTPIDKGYADGRYTWKVSAIDAAGQALPVADGPEFDKTSGVPMPEDPGPGETLPVLRWAPTGFAGSYNVALYTGTGFLTPYAGDTTDWSQGLQYPAATPTEALPAGTYSWRVQAVDRDGHPGSLSLPVLPFTIGGTKPVLSGPVGGAAVPVRDLEFAWTEVPGAVTYKLESSTTAGFNALTQTVTTTETSYTPSVAYLGGTTYFWKVTPLNAAGQPLATSDVATFAAQTAPAQPAKPSLALDGKDIDVTWTAPADGGSAITGYVVRYRVVNSGSAWTEVEVDGAGATTATMTGLAPSTTYEAQVAAVNAIDQGLFSLSQSKLSASLPGTVKSLGVASADRALNVTWQAPSVPAGGLPVTGYVVRWTPTAGGATDEKTVEQPNTTVTGLEDATEYEVEVAAINDMGTGTAVVKNGTTTGAPAVPDTVISTGPAAGATINTGAPSFAFAGNPAAAAASFECSVDGDAFAACTSPAALSGLDDGQHSFAVRAVDSRSRRDETPAERTFTVDTVAPETQLNSGPSGTTADTAATFTYSAPGAAKFECRLDGPAFAVCPSSGKSYTGLGGGEHTFAVRAVDAAGNADPTPVERTWTVTAPAASPSPSPAPAASASPEPSASPAPTASPAPAPTASPAPSAGPRCRVPKLKGKTRKAAKRALAKANCRPGTIKGPKAGTVRSQARKPGTTGAFGMKVGFTLKR